MTTIPPKGAPGFRFWTDIYESMRRGGLKYYPYSAIIEGFGISYTGAGPSADQVLAATPIAVDVDIATGECYLDGEVSKATAGATFPHTVNIAPAAVTYGVNEFCVFLHPTRTTVVSSLVPGAVGAPTAHLSGEAFAEGHLWALATFVPDPIGTNSSNTKDYWVATKFYQFTNGVWVDFDPTFAPPTLEGYNYIFGNGMTKGFSHLNVFLDQGEQLVYHKTMYPPYVNDNSHALMRADASLLLATAKLYYAVFPLLFKNVNVDDTAGTIELQPEDAAKLELIRSANVAGGLDNILLQVSPADSIAAAAVTTTALTDASFAGTTITLPAATTADLNGADILIEPQVATDIYLLIPPASVLEGSRNFVHQ